jgi:hypothetical protein
MMNNLTRQQQIDKHNAKHVLNQFIKMSAERDALLAQVDLLKEAGKAGFIAGANWLYASLLESDVTEDDKVDAANEYAKRIAEVNHDTNLS